MASTAGGYTPSRNSTGVNTGLTSPDGTAWDIQVDDDGNLTLTNGVVSRAIDFNEGNVTDTFGVDTGIDI